MDLLGTPAGAKGFFYESYLNKSGLFSVFHLNSEEVIRDRPISKSWTEKQREDSLRHLEMAKKVMSAKQYSQEYMGVFIIDFSQFFSDKLIADSMIMKRPERINPKNDYYLGVDVARMGEDDSTFEIIEKIDREHLIHVENIVTKKTYLNEVTQKILELDRMYNFKRIYIDDSGLGVGVFDYLLSNSQTKRKVVPINNRSRPLDNEDKSKKRILKEDLYNNLLGLMERGEIKLLDDDEIMLSLKSIQMDIDPAPNAVTRMKIFGNYSHITEGLIRAAFCNRDKSLNVWCR